MNYLNGGGQNIKQVAKVKFRKSQIKFFIANIIIGLEYLHERKLSIKILNFKIFVFDSDSYLRIIYLGVLRIFRDDNIQTQVICHKNHAFTADYYGLGVMGYQFMVGRRPYNGKYKQQISEDTKDQNSEQTRMMLSDPEVQNLFDGYQYTQKKLEIRKKSIVRPTIQILKNITSCIGYFKREEQKIKTKYIKVEMLTDKQNKLNDYKCIDKINLLHKNVKGVNSDTLIKKFNEKNKEYSRVQQSQKKQIQQQIMKTTYKLKIKRFKKPINLAKIYQKYASTQIENQIGNCSNSSEGLYKFKNFDQFIKKKRVHNVYLKEKMKLFGNAITDRQKASVQKNINMQIENINMQIEDINTNMQIEDINTNMQIENINTNMQIEDIKQRTCRGPTVNETQRCFDGLKMLKNVKKCQKQQQKIKKMQKFTICHMILQKYFQLLIESPKNIILKHENPDLYKTIKTQMLQMIINNHKIQNSVAFLQNNIKTTNQYQFKFNFNQLKSNQFYTKTFYHLKQHNNQLIQQINQTFQVIKQLISVGLNNLNRPDIVFHLQQIWENREQNTIVDKPKKRQALKKCLRATTIKRFRYPSVFT